LDRTKERRGGETFGGSGGKTADTSQELSRFVESLSMAWREGEVRPTHRRQCSGPRAWRTRLDPFEKVWPLVEQWLNEQPDTTAKDLFHRLQAQLSEPFHPVNCEPFSVE
jgi:hypothetical protein